MARKRRMRHPQSIMRQTPGTCYLCERMGYARRWNYLERHHVFPGNPGRRISEENGFTVRLCVYHHRDGREAVHNNRENMRRIQRDVQREYEKTHTRQQWMKLIGRNYQEDEDGRE